MALEIKQSWMVKYESKTWKIPDDYVKLVEGRPFVKLAGYNVTLANLLVPDQQSFVRNLSLSSSKGFKSLQHLRNATQDPEESDGGGLFGKTSASPKKKTRKAVLQKDTSILAVRLPDGGSVDMLSSAHPLQDVWISLDSEAFEKCIDYMRAEGLEAEQKRKYGGADEEEQPAKKKAVAMGGGRKAVRAVGADGAATDKYVK